MLSWIINNIGTIVVALIICTIAAIIIVKMIKDKKKGKSSCGCGCSNCPMSGSCHRDS